MIKNKKLSLLFSGLLIASMGFTPVLAKEDTTNTSDEKKTTVQSAKTSTTRVNTAIQKYDINYLILAATSALVGCLTILKGKKHND